MADLKTIEDLTNAFGPSGFEEEVVKSNIPVLVDFYAEALRGAEFKKRRDV